MKIRKSFLYKAFVVCYIAVSIPSMLFCGYKFIRRIVSFSSKYGDFRLEQEIGNMQSEEKSFLDYHLIAHAGGAVFKDNAMLTYTNSKEAILSNYEKGHRVFEIDFNLTKDGKLAAVHDWEHGKSITGGTWSGSPTMAEWKQQRIYGAFTPMDINDIALLMKEKTDMFIVTDSKDTDKNVITKEFSEIYFACKNIDINIIDRFIPQIYYPKMLETLYAIYPFENVIYTLYQSSQKEDDVVAFVKGHQSIKAITMWGDVVTLRFIEKLNSVNKPVYCHTINKFSEALELTERGVYGFYTDYLY